MWRPRDHERYIGGYDPEHEMPDPDRRAGERWESDTYRRNARDTRYPYRWNADRFEDRFRDRRDRDEYELRWNRDARDARDREYRGDYDRGYAPVRFDRGWDYDRGYDRGYDRDRGYDFDRSWSDRNQGAYYEGDMGWRGDIDRAREFGGRGYDRDWRDRMRWERERDRDRGSDDWDRGRNRRW